MQSVSVGYLEGSQCLQGRGEAAHVCISQSLGIRALILNCKVWQGKPAGLEGIAMGPSWRAQRRAMAEELPPISLMSSLWSGNILKLAWPRLDNSPHLPAHLQLA